jgi:hypothetical protein
MRQFLLDQRRLLGAQYKATVRPIMLLFANETTQRAGFAAAKRLDNKRARQKRKRPGKGPAVGRMQAM